MAPNALGIVFLVVLLSLAAVPTKPAARIQGSWHAPGGGSALASSPAAGRDDDEGTAAGPADRAGGKRPRGYTSSHLSKAAGLASVFLTVGQAFVPPTASWPPLRPARWASARRWSFGPGGLGDGDERERGPRLDEDGAVDPGGLPEAWRRDLADLREVEGGVFIKLFRARSQTLDTEVTVRRVDMMDPWAVADALTDLQIASDLSLVRRTGLTTDGEGRRSILVMLDTAADADLGSVSLKALSRVMKFQFALEMLRELEGLLRASSEDRADVFSAGIVLYQLFVGRDLREPSLWEGHLRRLENKDPQLADLISRMTGLEPGSLRISVSAARATYEQVFSSQAFRAIDADQARAKRRAAFLRPAPEAASGGAAGGPPTTPSSRRGTRKGRPRSRQQPDEAGTVPPEFGGPSVPAHWPPAWRDDLADAVQVAAGAEGTVFRARSQSLDRDVVVKIIDIGVPTMAAVAFKEVHLGHEMRLVRNSTVVLHPGGGREVMMIKEVSEVDLGRYVQSCTLADFSVSIRVLFARDLLVRLEMLLGPGSAADDVLSAGLVLYEVFTDAPMRQVMHLRDARRFDLLRDARPPELDLDLAEVVLRMLGQSREQLASLSEARLALERTMAFRRLPTSYFAQLRTRRRLWLRTWIPPGPGVR